MNGLVEVSDAIQYGVAEKVPALSVTVHAPAEMFPIDDTQLPCCEVMAELESQFNFAASIRLTPDELLLTVLTMFGAGRF